MANSGIPIGALTAPEFRTAADLLFGFTDKQSQTPPGWLTDERVDPVMSFCHKVAEAYREALPRRLPNQISPAAP